MPATRIWIPLIAFLGALCLVAAATLLPFVPSWDTVCEVTAVLALLGSIVAGVFLCRGIFLQTRDRMQHGFRVVLVVATSVVLAGVFYVAAMVSLLSLSGGFFAATFDHEVYFAEYDTTIYVYDDSFLDPATLVTYRNGFLPFEKRIGQFGGLPPSDLALTQSGEWVVSDDFKFNMATGEVVRLDM